MPDDPNLRFWSKRIERRENRGRRLDLQNQDLSTELGIVIRNERRVELVSKRLPRNGGVSQELGDGDVLEELRSGRLHLVRDVLVVGSHRDREWRRYSTGRQVHREASFTDGYAA